MELDWQACNILVFDKLTRWPQTPRTGEHRGRKDDRHDRDQLSISPDGNELGCVPYYARRAGWGTTGWTKPL